MHPSPSRFMRNRAGFTLLEVLLTLALIALFTAVLVVGTSRLLGDRPKTADELFWLATQAARKQALLQNQPVRLSFDSRSREFVLTAAATETRLPFVPSLTAELDFLPPKSIGSFSAILVGGEMLETQTQPFVTFYGDGTCVPFRVQLKGRTQTRILEIDPWTCAPMLIAQNAP